MERPQGTRVTCGVPSLLGIYRVGFTLVLLVVIARGVESARARGAGHVPRTVTTIPDTNAHT